MNDIQTLPIGTILKGENYQYCIEKVLGQGSFGITYLANIKLLGSLGELDTRISVAIKEFYMRDVNSREGTKVLTGSNSGIYYNYRKDFIKEANNLSKIKHPNIVKVIEAFECNNTAYYSMEYIDGGSYDNYIKENNWLSEYEALNNIVQIGEAISFMHKNSMLHLDLKPLNIMRHKNGHLSLIDFGLSKQFTDSGEPESSTRIGAGTMGYAPIEQANFKKDEGFPATLDIYALGATLFKSLTGITPPDASSIFNDGFPDDVLKSKGISQSIIDLTSWAMEPMKRKRPQTVEEFLSKINIFLPNSNKEKSTSLNNNSRELYKNTEPTIEILEECNGFNIRWSKNIHPHKKTKIRELIQALRYVGDKKIIVGYDEYGGTEYKTQIFSLGDLSSHYIRFLAIGENTDGCFEFNFTPGFIFNMIQSLEEWTSLPFRLASADELRYERSACPEYWGSLRTLCYSNGNGLKYVTNDNRLHELNLNNWREEFDFQIVCDSIEPVLITKDRFNYPYTQPFFSELSPIGFGFYKSRVSDSWNIRVPSSPLFIRLDENFEKISNITVWHCPGPGPTSGFDYLGIIAEKNSNKYYFRLESGKFELIDILSEEDIREREMWT